MEIVQFIPPNQRRLVMLAAEADTAPVLIHGSSGTGKGAIAKWIHANSPRATMPFVLADHDFPLIQQIPQAQGGTLYLAEIGEWPLSEQKILLQLLETKSIPHHPQSEMKMLVNVRLMVTTSQSLEGRAQGGLFNGDLLQKLNVFRLEMPPLSKRSAEFEEIVLGLTEEITRELHKEHVRAPSSEALSCLMGYEWPGNLRELRNVLRLAVLSAKGDRIELSDLPDFGHDRVDFRATREEFEKTYIVELLKTFDWQIDVTCQMTRMDKNTLLSKIKKYGIKRTETSIP